MEVEKHYHVPSMPNYAHRKRNAVFYGSASIKHELAKALGCIMIRNWSDIKFTPRIVELITQLESVVEFTMKDFIKSSGEFITEAVPNERPDRRVDVVCLDTDARYEFETDKKINKGGDVTTILI